MTFPISLEVLLAAAAGLCALLIAGIWIGAWGIHTQRRLLQSQARLLARIEEQDRTQERSERAIREEFAKNREEAGGAGRMLREEILASIQAVRGSVDTHLDKLRDQNSRKLDEMRQTVDEKLQGTLEKRLGESFRQVSERLEAVHQGLGEMQGLASGVGDLKKVLTNVKARGTWGELQLGELLDQVLAPEQFERNVATRRGSAERVEFAVRMPGPDEDGEPVWLPIDSKFPQEDYLRLLEAQEKGDVEAAEKAGKQIEARIKLEARNIRDKYLNPPRTTDFAVMFLPTEGLYAEVQRRPGLADVARDHRVVIAGPTNLAALLSALKMGFRTLAIQKRSSEVWKLLGAVRTQFGQWNGLLEKVQVKLRQASDVVDDASKRGRRIEKKLDKVEELPAAEVAAILPEEAGPEEG